MLTAWMLTEIVFDGLCSKRTEVSASSKGPFLKSFGHEHKLSFVFKLSESEEMVLLALA